MKLDRRIEKLYGETYIVMLISVVVNVIVSLIDTCVVSRFLGDLSVAAATVHVAENTAIAEEKNDDE